MKKTVGVILLNEPVKFGRKYCYATKIYKLEIIIMFLEFIFKNNKKPKNQLLNKFTLDLTGYFSY